MKHWHKGVLVFGLFALLLGAWTQQCAQGG
jgi:hypothetical protein